MNSVMPSSPTSLFIKGLGTGAPAMIPVLKFSQLHPSGRSRPRISSNIVGTPWRAVHLSSDIARSTERA